MVGHAELSPEELGKRVRDQRLGLGLSQEALAERAGISKETIGRIEQAIGSPTLDSLNKVARGLGTTGAVLIAEHPFDEVTQIVRGLPEREQEIARVMIRALSEHVATR
jgi:transcriptional regulator with XRE-family HTH domain